MSMVNNLPAGWTFSAFSISRNQLPYVALAILAGGNVRVGLEDNIWLEKGVLATNADLVGRAVAIAENMGVRVLGPEAVREKLSLPKAPVAGRRTSRLVRRSVHPAASTRHVPGRRSVSSGDAPQVPAASVHGASYAVDRTVGRADRFLNRRPRIGRYRRGRATCGGHLGVGSLGRTACKVV